MYSFCKRRRAPCDRVRDSLRRKKKLPFTVHTWKNPMSPLVVHFVVGDAAPHFWVFIQFCPSHLQFLGIFTQFCPSPPQNFCFWISVGDWITGTLGFFYVCYWYLSFGNVYSWFRPPWTSAPTPTLLEQLLLPLEPQEHLFPLSAPLEHLLLLLTPWNGFSYSRFPWNVCSCSRPPWSICSCSWPHWNVSSHSLPSWNVYSRSQPPCNKCSRSWPPWNIFACSRPGCCPGTSAPIPSSPGISAPGTPRLTGVNPLIITTTREPHWQCYSLLMRGEAVMAKILSLPLSYDMARLWI